jgi:hypothetical protein
LSEKERLQLAEQCGTLTMATQQNSELVLQFAAIKKELQETKKRQGVLSFQVWLRFRVRILCSFHITDIESN